VSESVASDFADSADWPRRLNIRSLPWAIRRV
jgi:hypothetical protein